MKDKFSLAKTFKKKRVNIGGGLDLGFSLTDSLRPANYVSRYETFKTSENTWEDINESESYVKTGDPIRQFIVVEEPKEYSPDSVTKD